MFREIIDIDFEQGNPKFLVIYFFEDEKENLRQKWVGREAFPNQDSFLSFLGRYVGKAKIKTQREPKNFALKQKFKEIKSLVQKYGWKLPEKEEKPQEDTLQDDEVEIKLGKRSPIDPAQVEEDVPTEKKKLHTPEDCQPIYTPKKIAVSDSLNDKLEDVENYFSIYLYEKILEMKKGFMMKDKELSRSEVMLELDKFGTNFMVAFSQKLNSLKTYTITDFDTIKKQKIEEEQ